MFNILSTADTAKKITSIKGRAGTLRTDIDTCARSAFAHAAETGDLTLASKLHNAVSRSFQADLKRYFTTFAPVRFDSKSKQFKKTKKGGMYDPLALDTAFDAVEKPDTATPEFDQAKAIANVIKAMAKIRDNAEESGDVDMAIKFEVLIGELSPAKIEAVADLAA